MLDRLKYMFSSKRRCGVCLFKLEPGVGSLKLDVDSSQDLLFSESDYHEFTRDDLVKSAGRGCKRCKGFMATFESSATNFSTARWWPAQPGMREPYLELVEASLKFELNALPKDDITLLQRDTGINSLHPCIRHGLKVVGSTGDDKCLDQAAAWLDSCRQHHDDCSPNEVMFCPTRLLFLGDENMEMIRLIENPPKETPYAALSHRWTEGTLKVRLLHDNHSERISSGFPLNKFPPMMRDVIYLLRKLGIMHVWIDCMCIIQDDREDWRREAATMASVYSNAELTVAATMAGQHLFTRRDGKEYVQAGIDDTDEASILLRRSLPHFTWQDMEYNWFEGDEFVDAEREWPLLSRGWTYQEQLLSKRTLHFTRHEMIWECNSTMECECGWYIHSGILEMSGTTQKKQSVESKSWNQIVKEYSKRELTFGTDKLPALAGIAKAFSEGNDGLGQYACGMWEHQLEECFFWSLAEDPRLKPSDGSMPSWSWASVSGNVSCWEVSVENVEFLGVSVSYNGEPLMGEVLEAAVTLSGPLVPATLAYGHESPDGVNTSSTIGDKNPDLANNEGNRYRLRIGDKLSPFRPDYVLDNPSPTAIPHGSPVFCLIFGRSTSSSFDPEQGIADEHTAACFLVLAPVDETNSVFQRIGLFDGSSEDGENVWELEPLLELSEKRIVTLI
ncbi:hypothetical protein N0V84_008153 [Fusarium piperis]|uniref:Heterokaryon incompatibility domain-containing protein n=1 Tax=Fusarium piperis TaxID=1435070 RepID=A0A9W9BL27_9HYPO|nr:hypothetical protein N0V84_008153 [Fusarium piperis]